MLFDMYVVSYLCIAKKKIEDGENNDVGRRILGIDSDIICINSR